MSKENILKIDSPITKYDDDILDRKKFASQIRKIIKHYENEECLTLGIMGSWGSGKTSFINMIFDQNEDNILNKKEFKVMRFNPWNFSRQQDLYFQFFEQLQEILISNENDEKNLKHIKNTINKYWEKIRYNATISLSCEGIVSYSKHLGEKTLETHKKEINKILGCIDYKLIIIIDDIDRLTNDEIQQIFILVKSLADFLNIIYILPFDRNIILTSMGNMQNGYGEEYLDKIIQLQIDLPKIPKYKLKEIFKKELEKLIQNENIGLKNEERNLKSENRDLWSILDFLTTIRAVNRYINNLIFYLPLMKNELNFIDSIILIGLQLFENKIYHEIKNNKEFFIKDLMDEYVKTEFLQTYFREILDKKENLSEERLTKILTVLFPQLINVKKRNSVDYDSEWNSQLRICSSKMFDKYFELTSSATNFISNSHFEKIIQSEDYNFIKKEVLQNDENGKSEDFLIKLKDNAHKIDPENIKLFFRLLYDIGDELDVENGTIVFSKNTLLLENIRSLAEQLNNEKLYEAMNYAIINAECLDLLVDDLSSHDKNNQKVQEKKKLTDEQLDALKKQACIKIKNWADEGKLFNVYRPLVLYEWCFWDNEEYTNFINKIINDDAKIINLLKIFSSTTNGIAKFDFKMMDEICPTDKISDRIKKINQTLEDETDEKFICESFIEKYVHYKAIKYINK